MGGSEVKSTGSYPWQLSLATGFFGFFYQHRLLDKKISFKWKSDFQIFKNVSAVTKYQTNNWAECPKMLVSTNIFFFLKIAEQGTVNRERKNNDEGEKWWQEQKENMSVLSVYPNKVF